MDIQVKKQTTLRAEYMMILIVLVSLFLKIAHAQEPNYLIKPGDTLGIAVWKEADLTGDVVVHPDGLFSVPLAGEIRAEGRTTSEIQEEIAKRLETFIPEAIVTISLRESVGANIYVIGQVNAPGTFNIQKPVDVMQALSLAQGMTAYAAVNKIKILRREKDKQKAIGFRYGDVIKGQNLEQNILLRNGDTVVVP